MIRFLVERGADVMAISRIGQTTADMANGPYQRTTPYPDAIALLESARIREQRQLPVVLKDTAASNGRSSVKNVTTIRLLGLISVVLGSLGDLEPAEGAGAPRGWTAVGGGHGQASGLAYARARRCRPRTPSPPRT